MLIFFEEQINRQQTTEFHCVGPL